MREPGFYYGAMFISYIVSGILSLILAALFILVLDLHWKLAIALLAIILILGFSYLFKVSRAIWIHFFVPYRGDVTKPERE